MVWCLVFGIVVVVVRWCGVGCVAVLCFVAVC